MSASGTTPAGTADERQAAEWVRGMFARVAPRYDLVNRLMSGRLDVWWRNRAVRAVEPWLGGRVLDLACGTCDLLLAMERAGARTAFGSDFCHAMLVAARKKHIHSPLFEADALRLPLKDGSFDLVAAAYGFRNFSNYARGLAEMFRILKPGGAAAILELSTPPNPAVAAVHGWYSKHIMPAIGAFVTGHADAYVYLPESVRKFPGAEELAQEMREAGFEARFLRMTFGIAALHIGVKPSGERQRSSA
jgi:demethylmenaquinone methyltransferase/2-methoxy-6-polyprenyl-1,4-benzoquinol methylase